MTHAYNKNNPSSIQFLFNHIAKKYDLGNQLLSFGLFRLWNKQLIKKISQHSSRTTFLDLCCGTGDIAITYLKNESCPHKVYLLDFSKEMLVQAEQKAAQFKGFHQIHFLHEDAQAIPLPDNSVDCITMAYGIRNIQEPKKCLNEVLRVIRPGGYFGILELTRPTSPILRFLHCLYLKTCAPIMGRCIASDKAAYEYLQQSIYTFISPDELRNDLIDTGFCNISKYSLNGGIATILCGQKPVES